MKYILIEIKFRIFAVQALISHSTIEKLLKREKKGGEIEDMQKLIFNLIVINKYNTDIEHRNR